MVLSNGKDAQHIELIWEPASNEAQGRIGWLKEQPSSGKADAEEVNYSSVNSCYSFCCLLLMRKEHARGGLQELSGFFEYY